MGGFTTLCTTFEDMDKIPEVADILNTIMDGSHKLMTILELSDCTSLGETTQEFVSHNSVCVLSLRNRIQRLTTKVIRMIFVFVFFVATFITDVRKWCILLCGTLS